VQGVVKKRAFLARAKTTGKKKGLVRS
jgi:hypothetical protein